MPPTREWTVMFYLASDNPLAPGTVPHLKAMKSAGYHQEVNVIAQFDPNTVNMPVHIFEVNRMEKIKDPKKPVNIGFGADDSFVRNLLADKLWSGKVNANIKESLKGHFSFKSPVPSATLSRDRNPKESVEGFLNFCRSRYPARHYMLFFLGHGMAVGDDLFLFDEHGSVKEGNSQPRSLLLSDLGGILERFKEAEEGKGELELVGFHSCSMSGAEVALELKDKANYMLASQGTSYLHSWPYRQILIRLFSEVGLPSSSEAEPNTTYFVDGVKAKNGGAKSFRDYSVDQQPEPEFVVSSALGYSKLPRGAALVRALELEPEDLIKHKKNGTNGNYLKMLRPSTKADIKELMIGIFQRCLYNTYDFALAGYSSDLTLCDLKKVGKLEKPVKQLVKALQKGLKSAADDPVLADQLVLAHWEAQSFYEEKYTDLYDFCLRLRARCRRARSKKVDLKSISDACFEVMKVLKRGVPGDDDGIIVRSEFCGAASQYAHGLSVFFPWSEPVGTVLWDTQYNRFEFDKETGWAKFLNDYFDRTMRKPQHVEDDPLEACLLPRDPDQRVLDILEQVNTDVFPGKRQLKAKAKDTLGQGKSGSQDPQGSDCDCGSIKNYPPLTPDSDSKENWVRKGWIREGLASRPVANLYSSYRKFFRLDRKPTSRH